MALYRYIAAKPSGSVLERGELAADSAYQVRVALRRMGLLPTAVEEIRPRSSVIIPQRMARIGALVASVARSRRRSKLIELYEGLAALVGTGTPIAAALDVMAGADRRMKSSPVSLVCRQLAERLRRGDSFADAMAQDDLSAWFSPIDVALVRVAEQTGALDRSLSDLASLHGQRDKTRGQLVGALAYPGLLLAFGLGVVIFLTTSTLPKLAGVLLDAHVEVPPATRVLLAIGHAITDYWPLALLALALAGAVFIGAMTSVRLGALRLRLPLLGRVLLRGQLGEASVLLAELTRSGIPLTEALVLVAPSVSNPAIRSTLTQVAAQLRAGQDVGSGLRASTILEPVFCRVLEVGQESGEMPQALATIGERYRASARRLTDRLATVLEPVVILVLATLVGFVVYAAVSPMLKLSQTIVS